MRKAYPSTSFDKLRTGAQGDFLAKLENHMLKELIDQFYLDNQKNGSQTKFYITDAGKCPRAVFFKL